MRTFSCIVAILATSFVLTAKTQRIAVFSDTHVSPGNSAEKALRCAVSEVNNEDYDLVVVNGDLTNEGSDEQIANVKSILDDIKAPLAVLPGNHENNWSQSATQFFVDTFGSNRFVKSLDSLVVIGLDCGPYMKMGDGHVKQEDLHWLKTTLDKYVNDGVKVLSFNHYPVRDNDLDNWREYAAILCKYPIIAQVAGHYHQWNQYQIGDINAVIVRALESKNKYPGYAIIEIDNDWVHIYEKLIGRPRTPMYAFPVKTKHEKIASDVFSDSISQPRGFKISKLHADSASVFTRLSVDHANVYFGTSIGVVRAIDKVTGKLKWQHSLYGSIFSRPILIRKNTLSVPFSNGIAILNSNSGKLLKTLNVGMGPYVADGIVSSDGTSYIQGGYKRIDNINANNTKRIWTYDSIFNYCQASPTIKDDDVIFGSWDTNLRCLSLKTGKLKWCWNNGKDTNLLSPGNVVPVITNDNVYIVAPDRYMTAIDRQSGRRLWRNNSHKFRESLGVSQDGTRLYAKTMDGELVAVDITVPQYKELWTIDLQIGYDHAPCVVTEADGVVYAGSRHGVVTAVDPFSQQILWSRQLGQSEINGFELDEFTHNIYLSLVEGTIFVIENKQNL